MQISDLFRTKKSEENTPIPEPVSTIEALSPDAKNPTETYVYYGTRICGKVTASLPVLSAFLPKIFNAEKQRQKEDEELQNRKRDKLAQNLNEVNNSIARIKVEKEKSENKISWLGEKIAELKEKLTEEKSKNGELNKMANVKLIIGLVILTILTVYLFVFYSSTFYSAFFKEFTFDESIGAAMFDSQAIPNSWMKGFGQFLFIICAPIIFLGLGYGLHFFMMQKSLFKYVKTGSILFITLSFDCILAYLIAEKMYNLIIMTKLGNFPDFNVKMAMEDVNFWAVIFCGFIVYIIWGIVFDMTLTAYEDLRSNKKEINMIEQAIEVKRDEIEAEKEKIANHSAELSTLETNRKAIEFEMSHTYHYEIQVIKTAINDFFSGWMAMMGSLNRSRKEQEDAHTIYNKTVATLFEES